MFVVLVLYVHVSVCSWHSVPQASVPDGVMILPDSDLDFPPGGGDISWRGRYLNHRSGWMHIMMISVIMIILVVTGLAMCSTREQNEIYISVVVLHRRLLAPCF